MMIVHRYPLISPERCYDIGIQHSPATTDFVASKKGNHENICNPFTYT